MIKTDIKGNMSEAAKNELMTYINLINQQKGVWEAEFMQAEILGDKNSMYERFVEMVNHGMIPADDYRLCEKNVYRTIDGEKVKIKEKYTKFDGVVISKKLMYNPKTDSYIGQWVFGWLPKDTGFVVKSFNHWGIRAEKGCEAPVVFPENYWPIEVKLIDNVPKAEQAANGLCKVFESNGKTVTDTNKGDIINFFRSGYQRVYTITCNKWATFDKDIGYIRVFYDAKTDKLAAMIHLNWKIIVRKFISITSFLEELKKAMSEGFGNYTILVDSTWYKNALDAQKEVINKNNAFAEKAQGAGLIEV